MRKRVTLHIGTPKTGTTYIQHCLIRNRDRLAGQGVLIPKAGSNVTILDYGIPQPLNSTLYHHPVAWRLQDERRSEFAPWQVAAFDSFQADFAAEFESGSFSDALLSSECLYWEICSAEGMTRLRRSFEPYDVRVVVFLRSPVRFLESAYTHAVFDSGFAAGVESFLDEKIGLFDYNHALSPWREAFGRENVVEAIYAPERGTNIFIELLSAAGLDVDADHLIVPEGRSNTSLSPPFGLLGEDIARRQLLAAEDLRDLLGCSKGIDLQGSPSRCLTAGALDRLESIYAGSAGVGSRATQRAWLDDIERYRQLPLAGDLRFATLVAPLAQFQKNLFEMARADARHQAHLDLGDELDRVRTELAFRGREVDEARLDPVDRTTQLDAARAALTERTRQVEEARGQLTELRAKLEEILARIADGSSS